MPSRRDRPEFLLSLVEGSPGSWQEAAGWRHGARGDLGRGQGPSPRGVSSEGGRGRTDSQKPSAQKKRDRGWGGCGIRYPASEKLEIIQLVEQSHLPVRRTLEKLGIPRATFYRWYDLYRTGGPEALEINRSPRPDRVGNRIPNMVREGIDTLTSGRQGFCPLRRRFMRPQRSHRSKNFAMRSETVDASTADQVALDVERVVNGRVDRNKALSRFG